MKTIHLQDLLFSILILCVLLFLTVPYLPIILSTGLILTYCAFKKGVRIELGFIPPARKFRTVGIALLTACLLVTLSFFILRPAFELITGVPLNLGSFSQLQNNPRLLIISITIGWLVGGFMEEIIFRGFFLTHIMEIIPGRSGAITGIIISAFIFGYLHDYQGITGQLLTGTSGLILAAIYVANQRKIWLNILIHGFVNTISMLLLYFGVV
tara:strand:- start:25128 stop:25763 length:636 start_codon:yes stop_codon:yes gene_type:complete